MSLKLNGGTLKYLLKKMGDDLLPREVMYRRKMGFGVPVGEWMRNELRPLVHDTVLSHRSFERGYFQRAGVEQLAKEHLDGKTDHSYQLWALLCLEMWHREFVD